MQKSPRRVDVDRVSGKPQTSLPAFLPFCLLLLCLLGLSACSSISDFFSGGGNWQASGLQQHIRTLLVDANNTLAIYAGDEQQGVFASTDGGQHWAQQSSGLPLPTAVHALSFSASRNKLYAATDAGLFVSADASQHWQPVGGTGLPTDSYTALAVDSNSPHVLYAGTAHHGILKSGDDGATWASFSNGLPLAQAVHGLTVDTRQKQIWAGTDRGLYYSETSANAWQAIAHGFPASAVVYNVQLPILSGGRAGVILAGTNQGLLISQDGGVSWQQIFPHIMVYSLLYDFRDSRPLYLGTEMGTFRSDDRGQNWRTVAPGLPKQPTYALALGGTTNSQLLAASDDIYLYPGKSSGVNFGQIFVFLLIVIFFYLLYRFVRRGSKRSRNALKPERIIESPSPSEEVDEIALVPFKVVPQDVATSSNGHLSAQEASAERDEKEDI